MGILSKVKSTVKKITNTAKQAVAKATGQGTGGGGGGSFTSKPTVNNSASAIQSKPTSSKVSIPTLPAGPQSKLPSTASKISIPTLPNGPQSKNINPALTKYATPDIAASITGKPIKKSTSSKTASTDSAGPQSMLPGTPGGMTYDTTQLSRTSAVAEGDATDPALLPYVDYSILDGGIIDGAPAMSESSSASSGSTSSPSSTSKSGGGSGSSAATSSRGANTQSAAESAMSRSDENIKALQGLLAEKQDELAKLLAKDESAAADAVSSDTTETQQEKDAMNSIDEPDDSALKLLDEELKNLRENLRNNESAIGGAYDVKKAGMQGDQASETGETSAAIAAAGGYLGFSGSGQGVMLTLAESHRAELVALESQRQNALQEARNAAATRRYDIVRLKAAEIARIDQEKYERTKEYNDEVKKETTKQKEEAKTLRNQTSIMKAITAGAKTVQDIFKKTGGTIGVDEIGDVLEKIGTSGGGTFKFTADDTATLLGGGMSIQDISALNEYVSENGYTDEVRAQLTPRERAAADKVYNVKTGNNSDTSFVTSNGTPISSTTLQVLDGFTTLKNLTPTAYKKVKDELYELGFNSDTVPAWFDAETAADMAGSALTQQFLENYYKVSMEPSRLADAMRSYTNRFTKDMWRGYRNKIISQDAELENSGGLPTDINELPDTIPAANY